jgi:hypothetical protein
LNVLAPVRAGNLPRGVFNQETLVPDTLILTTEQLDEFDRRGVLHLPGFYPRDDIDTMADRLWADLERRFGMLRDRPETWTKVGPAHFQSLVRSGAFAALDSPWMSDLADALLGAGAWDKPPRWGNPLVTFPSPVWGLPRPPWHLDIGGCRYLTPLPILRAFTFLEPVLPSGGGTLYVAGSHRLALEMDRASGGSTLRSVDIRKRLMAGRPWFARLLAAPGMQARELMGADTQAGDLAVGLEEMTGAPGDVILMHPAVLHATAHNALDRPRLMLTVWIPRRGAYA